MLAQFNSLFVLWALLVSLLAYLFPGVFTPHKGWISPLLMAIMFFMGLTITWRDFMRVLKRPFIIFLTVFLQFMLMPLFAWGISTVFSFSTDLMVGMILVGAVSGGTASNVMTYLSKGDVALSVSMTMLSTILSVVVTPLIIYLYVGNTVEVETVKIFLDLLKLVLLPIVLGMILNYIFRQRIESMGNLLATLSMLAIISIIAIVVALNHQNIESMGVLVLLGVILHNTLGLASGYIICKLLGYDEKIARTVAIEVGMQNSGLAASLGNTYFSQLSALPGAIFSVWHNLSGALLASYWSKRSSVD